MPYAIFESPFGALTLLAGPDHVLRRLYFPGTVPALDPVDHDPEALAPAVEQLEQYFAGERTRFELTLDYGGTPFQHSVWRALRKIKDGTAISYAELARRIGKPKAVRAVGLANGQNPISIVVPCHRVIGSDGSLTGYGGGLPRKRWLLEHEGVKA